MIKQITACFCDICGRMADAKQTIDCHNEIIYARPSGWSGGANDNIDICPECTWKQNQRKYDYGSFIKQIGVKKDV